MKQIEKPERENAELTRRLAEATRELGALRECGPDAPFRAVKRLLDKLTKQYSPPGGKVHELHLGRDRRLQLLVWDGEERVPLSFDERDGDLEKGVEEVHGDVRRMVDIYRQARAMGGPWPAEPEAEEETERTAVLMGITYVMRQRQPHGCSVRLSLAERFLNWYAGHTKLYIRGQRGKGWEEQRRLDAELAVALEPFLRQLVDEEVGIRLAEQGFGDGRIEKALRAWQVVLQRAPAHKTIGGGGLLELQAHQLREGSEGEGSANWLLAELIEAIGETASLRGALGERTSWPILSNDPSFGREAEELRSGIETVIKMTGEDDEAVDIVAQLQRLLDEVDARDSLAHLEGREADKGGFEKADPGDEHLLLCREPGEWALWWRAGSAGYTVDLDEAGAYAASPTDRMGNGGGQLDVLVSRQLAERLARRRVPLVELLKILNAGGEVDGG